MKDSDPILEELRKISAWADMQRKMTKWSLIFVAVFIPAIIAIFLIVGSIVENRFQATVDDITSDSSMSWYSADQHAHRGDFDSAIQMGTSLIELAPLDPESHRRMARICLSAGRIQDAERHYAEAYRLFPSESAQELLDAIRKRVKTEEDVQPDESANLDSAIAPSK